MRKRILPEEWSYCSIKGNLVYFNELSETSLWWKVSKFLSEAESIFDANGTSSIEFRREFEKEIEVTHAFDKDIDFTREFEKKRLN